jgi:AcrR family transcriptional regulator
MRVKDFSKIDIVFAASLKLIRDFGFAGITMAKIAKESQMATGTLYIYFKNKEELINALYQNVEKKSSARFLEGYDPEQPFKICLKKIWVNYLKNRIENHEESVFMEQYYHSPYITLAQKKIAEEMRAPVHAIINRGKKEGLLDKNIDTDMHFAAMIGFIREMAYEHVGGRYILNNERINKAFEINWRMIKE